MNLFRLIFDMGCSIYEFIGTWFMHDRNSVQYYEYCILDINYQNSEEALVRIRSLIFYLLGF